VGGWVGGRACWRLRVVVVVRVLVLLVRWFNGLFGRVKVYWRQGRDLDVANSVLCFSNKRVS
jgi:hypothetical protein